MKIQVFAALALHFLAASAEASSPGKGSPLLAMRGFKPGKCYRLAAVRRCRLQKGKLRCSLELLPDRTAALMLPLDETKDALIRDQETTDYGVFTFDLVKGPSRSQLARVRQIERIPLAEWASRQDRGALAKPVPCR